MQSIHSLIPDHEVLLNLELEELGYIIIEYLNSQTTKEREMLSYSISASGEALRAYPREYQNEIFYALLEARIWLMNEGLLAQSPGQGEGWVFITRRGRKLKNAAAVEAYRKANLLPKELLHPVMVDKVWHLFLRGSYDTAVFQAFKEVEVAVRNAGKYTEEDCDVELMVTAFDPKTGNLTEPTQTEGEKEGTLALFKGAMSVYKDPTCHKNVNFSAERAAEAIIFASHLFKIVDSSTPVSTTP